MGQFLISNMVIWSNNRRQGLAITCTNLCKVRRNMSQCPSEDITPSCHASFFRRLLYLFLSTDGLVSLRVVTDMYNRRITIYVWCLQQVSLCSNNFRSRQSCCHNIIILGKKGSLLAYNTRSVYCWDWLPQSWVRLTKYKYKQTQIINTNTMSTTQGQCIVEGRNWPLQSWVRVTSSPVLYFVYFYRADKPLRSRGRATKERNKNGTCVLPHIS